MESSNLQQHDIKELLKNEGFKSALKLLVLKIYNLDTVREINDSQDMSEIGHRQLANKLAIELVESWISEIFGVEDFDEFSALDISENEIFKRIDNKSNLSD